MGHLLRASVTVLMRTVRYPVRGVKALGQTGPRVWASGLVLLLVAVSAVTFFAGRLPAGDSGSGVIKRGEMLYARECAACHGETGERLPIAPLNSREFLDTRGDATLMAVLAEGKGVMPAFGLARGGPFSDEDVRAVAAFLSQRAGRQSTSILAGAGKALFINNCTACHGPRGDRIPIAPLNAKGFLDMKTDADLKEVIADGKGPMPPFAKEKGGKLEETDLDALIAFLRHNVMELTAQTASRGRELYLANCLQCHGVDGNRIRGAELASAAFLESVGDGAILGAINEGDSGVMPAFGVGVGGSMGVPDIAALLTYLKTWAGLNATSANIGAAAVPGLGREIFLRSCTACHGKNGDGVPGVRLFSKEFLNRETDSVLLQTITRGNAKGMPAWGVEAGGPFTESQVESILEYLKGSAISDAVTSPGAGQAPASGTAASLVPITAEAVARGKEVFMSTCTMCHGETRDKVVTCPLSDSLFLRGRGDETLINSITFGKGSMPSWGVAKGGPLSPDDVKAAVAYLKNAAGIGEIQQGSAKPIAVSEDLVTKGRNLFNGTCAMCHGETRDKIPTCQLANPDWLKTKGFDGVVKDVTEGKPPMMPAWGKEKGGALSADDIKAIVTYLWNAAGLSGGKAAGETTKLTSATQAFSAEMVAKGKETFNGTCAMCHGETRDKVPTCQLANPDWLKTKGFDGVVKDVTEGKPPMMPAWGKQLSTEQIQAVVSYLWDAAGLSGEKAVASGSSEKLAAVPPTKPLVPNVETGKQIFTTICSMCHGQTGLNLPQCPLGSRQWLSTMSLEGLMTRIRRGKPAAGMPTWGTVFGGPLSEEEILSVVMYLGEMSR